MIDVLFRLIPCFNNKIKSSPSPLHSVVRRVQVPHVKFQKNYKIINRKLAPKKKKKKKKALKMMIRLAIFVIFVSIIKE